MSWPIEAVFACTAVLLLLFFLRSSTEQKSSDSRTLLENGAMPGKLFLRKTEELNFVGQPIKYQIPDFGYLVGSRLQKRWQSASASASVAPEQASMGLEKLSTANSLTKLMLLLAVLGIVLIFWLAVNKSFWCLVLIGLALVAWMTVCNSVPTEIILSQRGISFSRSFGSIKFNSSTIMWTQVISVTPGDYALPMTQFGTKIDTGGFVSQPQQPEMNVDAIDIIASNLDSRQWLTSFVFLTAMQANFDDASVRIPLRLDAVSLEDRKLLRALSQD